MAAEPRNVAQEIGQLQAILQQFNTLVGPEGNQKTLAELLEISKMHEYVVLRALLKKHLGFEYDDRSKPKIYRCPVLENLQALAVLEGEISKDYIPALKEAAGEVNLVALQELRIMMDKEKEIIARLQQKMSELQQRIIDCDNEAALGDLKRELLDLEQNIAFHLKEDGFMASYQSAFQKKFGELDAQIRKYYIDSLSILLPKIENIRKIHVQLHKPVLIFSEEEADKYGLNKDETRLPDEKEERAAVIAEIDDRQKNLGVAIEHLERSVNRPRVRKSNARDYNPTQKARAFVGKIEPLIQRYHGKTENDFLPRVNTSDYMNQQFLDKARQEVAQFISDELSPVQEGFAQCRKEFLKKEKLFELKKAAEIIVKNYTEKTSVDSQNLVEAVRELNAIEGSILALGIQSDRLEWLKALKAELVSQAAKKESKLIRKIIEEKDTNVVGEFRKIEEIIQGLNVDVHKLTWLQELREEVILFLRDEERHIVKNYKGKVKADVIISQLDDIEAKINLINREQSNVTIIGLKLEAFKQEENYLIRNSAREFNPREDLIRVIEIEEEIAKLLGMADNPKWLPELRKAIKEEVFISSIDQKDMVPFLNAIQEAEYKKAYELLYACINEMRDRQYQAPPALSSSSMSSSSSSAHLGGVDPSHPLDRHSVANLTRGCLSSIEKIPMRNNHLENLSHDADQGELPQYAELFQAFNSEYRHIKENGVLAFARTKKQEYQSMAQVMDHVLSNPLTPVTKETTASAKAVMKTLGCTRAQLLAASHDYRYHKAAFLTRQSHSVEALEACFNDFVEKHEKNHYMVIHHFVKANACTALYNFKHHSKQE